MRWAALPEGAPARSSPASRPTPLDADGFGRLLDALGPLEPRPAVAVALSGGADSLALAHLAHGWLTPRGGRVVAVTVDHGLRPGAAAEARRVAGWMRAAGIPHVTLRWPGPAPAGNLQAAARGARYALLDGWCRDAGVLHLLTGHHADDQRETRVLRLARRAGPFGLAGMSAVEPLDNCQILRPLLAVPRARLEATLRARGLAWIEDPSNDDPRFDRVRVRQALPGPADDGLGDGFALARGQDERALARLLARGAAVCPLGSATLAREDFLAADPAIATRTLGAVLAGIAGGDHPPRHDRLAAALGRWRTGCDGAAITLGGCRLAFGPDGALVVTREVGRIGHAAQLAPGAGLLWDGRFRLRPGPGAAGLTVARLTDPGWRALCRARPSAEAVAPPRAIRNALPALWRDGAVVGLPLPGIWRDGPAAACATAVFAPRRALTRAAFVASAGLVCAAASVV